MLSVDAAMAAASALAVVVAAASSPRPASAAFPTRLAHAACGALACAPFIHALAVVLVGGAHPTDAAAMRLSAMVSAFAAAPLWAHTRGAGLNGLVALAFEPERWGAGEAAAAAVYPALGAAFGAWLGSAVALYDWAEAAGQVMPLPGALGCAAGWGVGWGVVVWGERTSRRRGVGVGKGGRGRGRGREA